MSDATPSTSDIGWVADIEAMTIGNDDFRRVLFTGGHIQLTVMSLAPARASAGRCTITSTSSCASSAAPAR